MDKESVAIKARNLTKKYLRGSEEIYAVNHVSLDIRTGEFVSVVGPSGSGKTTLINILGCLDNPTSGRLSIDGQDIFDEGKTLSERQLTRIRRNLFGYIFQKFYLIPTLNVAENIMLPFTFYRKDGAGENVARLLHLLGMEKRKNHLPGQLSGGEMQRVAIARALVNSPRILLADEPTGNLDTVRSDEIGRVLSKLNQEEGLTIILVTHNPKLAQAAHRIIELHDGHVKI
ncbi:MAG: ABC transporter ATP-binding protein [Desulfobacterales bacterium]|jgi:putative ABC transport system ATP-binding protein|nr:ABC transporter ATP-binding protein [Desulfobacterales bacterium]